MKMGDEINENNKVYNHYLELSKPTQEDFKRVFTDDELKELCLRHKCRVDMWRWNVANDYRMLFTESGRYQRWSPRDRLRMLTKAVNRMKPAVLYDQQEIIKTRKEEWGLQLKENILSLNFWQRKRRLLSREQLPQINSPRLMVSDSEEMDADVLSQCAVNTESMNMAELLTQTQSERLPAETDHSYGEFDQEVETEIEVNTESMNEGELLTQAPLENVQKTQDQKVAHVENDTATSRELAKEVQSQIEVNTESMCMDELLTQTQGQEPALENVPAVSRALTPAASTPSEEANILLGEFDEADYLIDDDSEDSVETVLNNEHQLQVVVETLQSEEVAPEIENIYGVNTMSMTIDSQMSTQSQDLPMLQSQDVIPASYDNFKNIIPLTSTQSQSHESEEIIVS